MKNMKFLENFQKQSRRLFHRRRKRSIMTVHPMKRGAVRMFRTGFYETEVTPPLGSIIPGSFEARHNESILKKLSDMYRHDTPDFFSTDMRRS